MYNACLQTEIIILHLPVIKKAYRDHATGTTENFVPKTFNMKTGVSKLSIPIHACTGHRAPGGSGYHNFWAIST
jgi:hypothetical protein